MPLVVGGVPFVYLLMGPISSLTKTLLMVWFFSLALLTLFYWKKEYPQVHAIIVLSLFGLFAFIMTLFEFFFMGDAYISLLSCFLVNILAGSILCASLHSMTLGHHYLNVRGLPIDHLKRATNVLWALLGFRILWDLYFLFFGKVLYRGDKIPIVHFLTSLDGFLLWIGIFFGIFLPFVALFFVKEILKFKNTQSATGILYIVLCSVLMGDLAYKYYLVKYGVAL